jgi:hypothetical protein
VFLDHRALARLQPAIHERGQRFGVEATLDSVTTVTHGVLL